MKSKPVLFITSLLFVLGMAHSASAAVCSCAYMGTPAGSGMSYSGYRIVAWINSPYGVPSMVPITSTYYNSQSLCYSQLLQIPVCFGF